MKKPKRVKFYLKDGTPVHFKANRTVKKRKRKVSKAPADIRAMIAAIFIIRTLEDMIKRCDK